MISSSILNVIIFNVLPFVTFRVKRYFFYKSFTPYLSKQREENYKKAFGETEDFKTDKVSKETFEKLD